MKNVIYDENTNYDINDLIKFIKNNNRFFSNITR